MYVLKLVVEKCYEFDITIHILFIDFKQTFDSVDRTWTEKGMTRFGNPTKTVVLVKMKLETTKAMVRTKQGNTDIIFEYNAGLRQGNVLSTSIFILVLESIYSET